MTEPNRISKPNRRTPARGTGLTMADLGARGGRTFSISKQETARQNGRKGGRPRKSQ